jgi:hypothetical protein
MLASRYEWAGKNKLADGASRKSGGANENVTETRVTGKGKVIEVRL